MPYYTGQVLDGILVKKNYDEFKNNVLLFIIVNFSSNLFGGLRTTIFNIGVAHISVKLRRVVFKALIEKDVTFFDRTKTGEMLSRLTSDTSIVSELISRNLNDFLWNLFRTIGTLIFIFKLSWQLTLSCFIGAPIVFSVGKLAGYWIRKYSSKVQQALAEVSKTIYQFFL